MNIPRLARRINDDMASWALDRLSQAIGGLAGKRILVLGLAYRENVKEPVFSGTLRLISLLRDAGAVPLVNDPLFTYEEIAAFGAEPASLDALPRGDAVILQAYHDTYRDLDWSTLAARGYRAVLDGRNAIDRSAVEAAGMIYTGMGR
jgi:UDP-N-acetyl-D-mannosaminuronate dehydrogenase